MNILFNFIQSYYKVLTGLLLLVISILSLSPLPELPSVPGTDKTHHFIAYATLAFPASLAKPKKLFYILLFFSLYSGMIELIQPYVNRHGEWLDFAANNAGVLLGFLLAWGITMVWKRS